jgi:predicted dehydrogenase
LVTNTRPVPIAVLGFGYWGANQARNVAASDACALRVIIEPDPVRAAVASRTHPGVPVVADIDAAMLHDPEAAVIATPAGDHPEVATALLEAGLHVLVEKPFTLSGASAEGLVALADRLDRRIMAGHTFLYSSPVRYLRELIASGELGRIQYLSFQRLSLGRIRSDCNVLWNLAPHDVSIAHYLLGEDAIAASATGFTYLQPGIADVVFGTLAFPSGAGAGMHLSWLDPRKSRTVTVVGTEKMVVYDDVATDRKIEIFDAGVVDPTTGLGESSSMAEWQWKTRAGDVVTKKLELWEPLRRQIDEFAAWIGGGHEVPSAGAHAVAVTRSLEALDDSIAAGGSLIDVKRPG